jgi:hypothetical protein
VERNITAKYGLMLAYAFVGALLAWGVWVYMTRFM